MRTCGVLDHLSIQCGDVGASARFFDEVLAPLGGQRVMDFGATIGYGPPSKAEFWIGNQVTGRASASPISRSPHPIARRYERFSMPRSLAVLRYFTSHACGPSTTRTTSLPSCAILT